MRIFDHIARDERGFSATELTVVSMITLMVIAAAWTMIGSVNAMINQSTARSIALEDARGASDRIVREIRQGRETTDGAGAFSVNATSEAVFLADVNADGFPERVRYFRTGDSLMRQVASCTAAVPPYTWGVYSTATTLVPDLAPGTTAIFSYYDASGTVVPTSNPSKVSAVSVRIRAEQPAAGMSQKPVVDLSSWVRIRSVYSDVQ